MCKKRRFGEKKMKRHFAAKEDLDGELEIAEPTIPRPRRSEDPSDYV